MAAKNKSNEIHITRIYDAPVKAVWDAWTDPKKAAKWWGPRGFTITTHSKDLRPGGSWVYTMHGPDGVDYPNKTVYFEVEKYARLVYDHGGYDDRPPLFRVTVVFSENKGRTTMEMSMALPTPEAAAETRKFIKKAGGDSTWDRLGEYLVKESDGKDLFLINRTFEAPLETMFEMWVNPQHFSKWLAPKGFEMTFIKSDIRTGGRSFFYMSNSSSSGQKMYGRAEYLEVVRATRVVYTQQFCDEKEKVTRHPMNSLWPETMLTTVTLSEEEPGRTRVTVMWQPHGSVTAAEVDAFVKERGGMTQGWTGSFDKLEDYLELRRKN
jgi:uncharacterized protein YndB with AHSA1/START domain